MCDVPGWIGSIYNHTSNPTEDIKSCHMLYDL